MNRTGQSIDLPRFDEAVRRLMWRICQQYQGVLQRVAVSVDQLPLLMITAGQPCSREEAMAFLSIFVADAEGVFRQAIEAGWVCLDDQQNVLPGDVAKQAFEELGPVAERFNALWLAELERTFRREDLERLLTVLGGKVSH